MQATMRVGRAALLYGAGVVLSLSLCGSAMAASIDVGNDNVRLRWDNTIRYNLGVRVDDQDARIMRNPNYDESDSKFDQGDIVTNRLDLLSEIDISYKRVLGARLSAAGWYDHAYRDDSVESQVPGWDTSYYGDKYSSEVDRYMHGPSGEVLDAFVWAYLNLGNIPLNIKVGRHTNYWGEGLLFAAHGISYSQAPMDAVKAATSPGIETKEVFLPLGHVSVQAQVTDRLLLAGQWFFEWDHTRFPYGGTYFGAADPFFEGPDRMPMEPGVNYDRVSSIEGRDTANWGLMAKLHVEQLDSDIGLYYRQFDDYQPWLLPAFSHATQTYRWVYPRSVKLAGVSYSRVLAGASIGADLSYRMDGALNADGLDPVSNQGPRGDTLHFVANAVYGLPRNWLADSSNLVVELAYSRLLEVTENEHLYKGEGRAACKDPRVRTPGSGSKAWGCSTDDYFAIAVNFTPQYFSVLPSWDLEVPLTVNYGLHGNAATAGGGSEGALSWSIGAKMTYKQRYEFGLRYADTHAQSRTVNGVVYGNGPVGGTDRGWLAFTFKTSL